MQSLLYVANTTLSLFRAVLLERCHGTGVDTGPVVVVTGPVVVTGKKRIYKQLIYIV